MHAHEIYMELLLQFYHACYGYFSGADCKIMVGHRALGGESRPSPVGQRRLMKCTVLRPPPPSLGQMLCFLFPLATINP